MSNSSYPVGYGKPPKHTQFRKGASGNRRGRPKGKRNFVTVLVETLEEKIVINEDGVSKTVTKLEAAVRQVVDQAVSGDLIALRQLAALARSAEDQAIVPPTKQLADSDLKIMQRILKRQSACVEGAKNEDA